MDNIADIHLQTLIFTLVDFTIGQIMDSMFEIRVSLKEVFHHLLRALNSHNSVSTVIQPSEVRTFPTQREQHPPWLGGEDLLQVLHQDLGRLSFFVRVWKLFIHLEPVFDSPILLLKQRIVELRYAHARAVVALHWASVGVIALAVGVAVGVMVLGHGEK